VTFNPILLFLERFSFSLSLSQQALAMKVLLN